ncbi:conserved hypothetical protein [Bacillus thuringiensis str. Al Hakam]|nr:conserved hypothetical protein [Bacillus thuringiensis str. Al Hakam]
MLPVNLRNSAFLNSSYIRERIKVIRISELQMKDIINVSDGKRLGNIGDIEIDMDTGKIESIIIAKQTRTLGIFGKDIEIVIRWKEIVKIGEDVILVRVNPVNSVTESIQTPTIS